MINNLDELYAEAEKYGKVHTWQSTGGIYYVRIELRTSDFYEVVIKGWNADKYIAFNDAIQRARVLVDTVQGAFMSNNESIVQTKIIKALEASGYVVIKLSAATKAGWPDLIVLGSEGYIAFIEVKTDKGVTSALQAYKLKLLVTLGFNAFIARGQQDIAHLLQRNNKICKMTEENPKAFL